MTRWYRSRSSVYSTSLFCRHSGQRDYPPKTPMLRAPLESRALGTCLLSHFLLHTSECRVWRATSQFRDITNYKRQTWRCALLSRLCLHTWSSSDIMDQARQILLRISTHKLKNISLTSITAERTKWIAISQLNSNYFLTAHTGKGLLRSYYNLCEFPWGEAKLTQGMKYGLRGAQ